ncbi:polysaccharide deacetylase family protein [Marinoscillum pacificum]|uniref:polysaccharide deacetylase family protein n=1 Tax=Marinoscillum pacificum TaxID=392723 RepID=UPI0021576AE4|nr:polysaccharide deacetylase family protein [Marinoscillum pacificum]
MRTYFFKNPWWLAKFYLKATFSIPGSEGIYLTFDDGPNEIVTPWVLDQLKKYNAKATFFLIGKMAEKNPELVSQIISEGHSIGGHTHHHTSGWQLTNEAYYKEIEEGLSVIPKTKLFRPPYGQIRLNQLTQLTKKGIKTVMWSHLSGDFDEKVNREASLEVLKSAETGSILVFHDSQKAFENLTYILPRVLDHFSTLRLPFKALPQV